MLFNRWQYNIRKIREMQNVIIPNSCSLDAWSVQDIISGSKTSYSRDSILAMATNIDELSIRELFSDRVMEKLDKVDTWLHPYIVNRLWIGKDLIYGSKVEEGMEKYIKDLE